MNLSMETICDWLEGKLDAEEATRVTARVEQNGDLAAQVEWLRLLLEVGSQFRITDPPPGLRANLEALFDERGRKFGLLRRYRAEVVSDNLDGRPAHAVRGDKSGTFRRYLAELVSDSWSGRPAPGMRAGESDGDTRHLVFSCQLLDISVTLRQHPEHGHTGLKGQILVPAGLDPGLCTVELACEAGQTRPAEADDAGEFEFSNLVAGKYHLAILGPGFEVSTPVFDVH